MEGPHSPGNARPYPLSGDRRIALYDHAGALWILLVRASRTRQIRARHTIRGSRIRDPGGAGRRNMDVAGPHPQRVRTRRLAGTSGANPLVSGTFGQGNSTDADLRDPVLRYWR